MPYEELKHRVYQANLALVEAGLVVLTWGNSSGADRAAGVMAIKPSGVPYSKLSANDMVVLDIASGEIVDGKGRPSSDTPTHLHLYREFPSCGGVVHTHSTFGTSFAQAQREIPCLGTTHADNFYGAIPVTRELTADEIRHDYELNTGRVIVECLPQQADRSRPGAGRAGGGACPVRLGRYPGKSGGKRHRAGVLRPDGSEHFRHQPRNSAFAAGADRQALPPASTALELITASR